MTDGFIVRVKNLTSGRTSYYATDSMSGGYPYFADNISQARKMSMEEVFEVLRDFKRPNNADGMPNMLAHQAGQISNKVLSATLEISVGQVVFAEDTSVSTAITLTVENRTQQVKIERERLAEKARAKIKEILTPEELAAIDISAKRT